MNADLEALLFKAALDAIIKIVETVKDARSGKLDPAKVLDQISTMHQSLLDDNARADAEAKAKFHPEG